MVLSYHDDVRRHEEAAMTQSPTDRDTHLVRAVGEGEQRWFFGGGVHTWKATSAQTNGAFMLFEDQMEKGKMTPLHIHPDSDESMYVLEGAIVMHLDGVDHVVEAGGLVVAARGVPHAFMAISEQVRLLCLHTPGGCDDFYLDASEPIEGQRPEDRVVDFARVQASAQRHGGIELLGPPPFAPAQDV
jgi:quercetin dioxygenase-like cupin family protein